MPSFALILTSVAMALGGVYLSYVAQDDSASSGELGSGVMFDGIAANYDFLNRVMSLGLDMSWRHELLSELSLTGSSTRVLDLATGTADVAILMADRVPGATILGVDPSNNMLNVGRGKLKERDLDGRITLELGDATDLENLSDNDFDAATMSFGIRNVKATERIDALRELHRVLRPGGKLGIMEFAEPREGIMGVLARAFVGHVVPLIGFVGSGDKAAYKHLQQSIADFPAPDDFLALFKEAGFGKLRRRELLFGVVQIYLAENGNSTAMERARRVLDSEAVLTAESPGAFAGKEAKHVPRVEVAEGGEGFVVSVPHGMAEEHFIADVFLVDEEGAVVAARGFGGGEESVAGAEATLRVSRAELGGVSRLTPYAYCNLHGLWAGDAISA